MKFTAIFKACIFSLIVGVSFMIFPSVSFAKDVWVYSTEYEHAYLDTEKIGIEKPEPQYRCLVNLVSKKDGKLSNFISYGFSRRRGKMIGFAFWRSGGYWEYLGSVASDAKLNAVWQAMKPYLKQRGVTDVESWN